MPQPRGWRARLHASLRAPCGMGEMAVATRLMPRVPEKKEKAPRGAGLVG
jgi:hypothetical protein